MRRRKLTADKARAINRKRDMVELPSDDGTAVSMVPPPRERVLPGRAGTTIEPVSAAYTLEEP